MGRPTTTARQAPPERFHKNGALHNDGVIPPLDLLTPDELLQANAKEASKMRPDTPAGRVVNSFRSALAKELRACAEDFDGIPPTAIQHQTYTELAQLADAQQKALDALYLPDKDGRITPPGPATLKAAISELRSTLKEKRMVGDQLLAYEASRERTALMTKGKTTTLSETLKAIMGAAAGEEAGEDDEPGDSGED